MRQQSAKTSRQSEERRRLVRALVDAGLWECQIGVVLQRAMFNGSYAVDPADVPCVGEPSGIHERLKRSSGGSLTMLAGLMPACSFHNGWVENEPELAHTLALVVRPGDHEWFLLGADRGGF